jgi:mannose-6-phosphate isomerase-like protein (cupin superfamily)
LQFVGDAGVISFDHFNNSGIVMNVDQLEKDWTERGFSFGVGTIKAGDAVDEAFHDDKDELVLMKRGEYEFVIGDETFRQDGNIEVFISAGSVHSIKNLGGNDSKIYFGYKARNSWQRHAVVLD